MNKGQLSHLIRYGSIMTILFLVISHKNPFVVIRRVLKPLSQAKCPSKMFNSQLSCKQSLFSNRKKCYATYIIQEVKHVVQARFMHCLFRYSLLQRTLSF